jgi:hypothetical protein
MGLVQKERTDGLRKFWPVIGFIMLIALGFIAYAVSPSLISWASKQFPNFQGSPNDPTVRAGFSFMVFVVLSSIAGLLMAVAIPRRKIEKVSEGKLAQERKEMLAARDLAKRRQRKINQKMRQG